MPKRKFLSVTSFICQDAGKLRNPHQNQVSSRSAVSQGETDHYHFPSGSRMSCTMPALDRLCQEVRIRDVNASWRVSYRNDDDTSVILGVETKINQATPARTIRTCQQRSDTRRACQRRFATSATRCRQRAPKREGLFINLCGSGPANPIVLAHARHDSV